MEFGHGMLSVDWFVIIMILDLELIFSDLWKAYLYILESGAAMKLG